MKRYDLERNVIDAAEICVDSGGVKYIGLAKAVKALRDHDLEMPTGALVGNSHPVTSKLAAEWMANEHHDLCAKVFREIARHATGMTTDAVQEVLGGKHQSISPRMTQLRDEGWIRDSGQRRTTRSGRLAIVWTLSNAALEALDGARPQRVRTYDRDGVPHDDVLRTKSGKVLTEQDILRFAKEDDDG